MKWVNVMRKLIILCILGSTFFMTGGCSAPDQYKWIPWYEFRGHCYLTMNITVDSLPAEAKVFVDGTDRGTTPYTLVLESAPYIAGEKRKLTIPQDGSILYATRMTKFLGKTKTEIMVVKDGYKPVKETITLEDYFRSDSLDHEKKYKKAVRLTYSLKEKGWSIFSRGKVKSAPPDQPPASP